LALALDPGVLHEHDRDTFDEECVLRFVPDIALEFLREGIASEKQGCREDEQSPRKKIRRARIVRRSAPYERARWQGAGHAPRECLP
jgi:hypothetical protein